MKVNTTKLITDLAAFDSRVDEIDASSSYSDIKHAVSEMKKYLYDHPDIVAICGPQLGFPLRLFVVKTAKTEENRFKVFLNPMIVKMDKKIHLSRETNASLPGKEYVIPRSNDVHVAYQEVDGRTNSESYFGAYGEVVQQMIQMLDGVTLADIGFDFDDVGGAAVFEKAPKKQQAEVISMYIDHYKKMTGDIQAEIDADPELSKLQKNIKFTEEMLLGNIKPLDKDGKEVEWKPWETAEDAGSV